MAFFLSLCQSVWKKKARQAQDAKRTQEKELYCFVVLFRERRRDKNQRETGGRAIKSKHLACVLNSKERGKTKARQEREGEKKNRQEREGKQKRNKNEQHNDMPDGQRQAEASGLLFSLLCVFGLRLVPLQGRPLADCQYM